MTNSLVLKTELNGKCLLVEFFKLEDRFSHRLVIVEGEKRSVVLQANEGDNLEEEPASPPIQDLSIEDRGDSAVALGVGMAGESMWSLSALAWKKKGIVQFDVACNPRNLAPPGRSTYHFGSDHPKPIIGPGDESWTEFRLGDLYYRASQESVGKFYSAPNKTDGDGIQFVAGPNHNEPQLRLIRWIYEIGLNV